MTSGVSPLHHPHPVRTFVDRAFEQYDEIWARRVPAAVFSPSYAYSARLPVPVELEVTDG